MAVGFFTPKTAARRVELPTVARCSECKLDRQCRSPKMPVYGQGGKKILVVGEAPGKTEDVQGRPFVGESGKLLESALLRHGVELRKDCWVTNALRCRPKNNEIKDPKAVDHCRPNLVNAIRELQPETVILLGAHAVRSLIGWLWREDSEDGISRWVGWKIPSQRINAWVCPVYHPSHLLRSGRDDREDPVLRLYFDKFLGEALSLDGRPWRKVPDYKKKIRLVYDHREAAREIRGFVERGNEVSIDYETDRLKCDAKDSQILCCSVSDGRNTVAYPWHGDAIPATGELWRSDVPKIASNAKFESRWTMRHFGFMPNNWTWDTMLAAHALDNRPGISSLKFQAFVRLGFGGYDDGVKPYISSDNSNRPNRLKEFPLDKLLEYCALDSLLEWLVAKSQREEFGWIT